MDALSIQRLAAAAPEFRRRATLMTDQLEAEGIPVRWTEAVRSYARQAALWAIGRTLPGRRVTNAPPGESIHEYGGAGDCVPMTLPHGQPDWDETHPAWARIVAVGEQCGLRAGARFVHNPDMPHFELPEMPEKPTDAMRIMLSTGGLPAVWAAMNVLTPPILPAAAPVVATKTKQQTKEKSA